MSTVTCTEAKNQMLAPEIVRALTELFLAVENQAEVYTVHCTTIIIIIVSCMRAIRHTLVYAKCVMLSWVVAMVPGRRSGVCHNTW